MKRKERIGHGILKLSSLLTTLAQPAFYRHDPRTLDGRGDKAQNHCCGVHMLWTQITHGGIESSKSGLDLRAMQSD